MFTSWYLDMVFCMFVWMGGSDFNIRYINSLVIGVFYMNM